MVEHKLVFPKPPMIAYSRSENLRDSLVKAKLPTREKNDNTYLVRNEEDPPSSPTLHTLQDLDLESRGFNMFIDFVEIEESQNTQGPTPSNRRQGHSSHSFRVHRGERGEMAPGANWHPTCFCSRVCCQPMAMMFYVAHIPTRIPRTYGGQTCLGLKIIMTNHFWITWVYFFNYSYFVFSS